MIIKRVMWIGHHRPVLYSHFDNLKHRNEDEAIDETKYQMFQLLFSDGGEFLWDVVDNNVIINDVQSDNTYKKMYLKNDVILIGVYIPRVFTTIGSWWHKLKNRFKGLHN